MNAATGSTSTEAALYRPPAPRPISATAALFRAMVRGERDLLSLLPREAYTMDVGWLGHSRRGILLLNDPAALREVMTERLDEFPKNDLMVGALAPLVGDSIFASSGETWRRQRRMIEPTFSHMRVSRAFTAMSAAVDAFEQTLDRHARDDLALNLDAAMSHVTADIICRTIFSRSLEPGATRDVFEAFTVFETSVANVSLRHLILSRPFATIPQPPTVLDACRRIRHAIGELLAPRLAEGAIREDIAGDLVDARDPETGDRFNREELIDELGVFFLAGHETTASALTWVLFILSQRPEIVDRLRVEIDARVGGGALDFAACKNLPLVRNVFRETLRLYPPLTFYPRVAAENTTVGGHRVRRGTMLMIAPWTIHRHQRLWEHPDRFDPDRFSRHRDGALVPGAYIPFGAGPRICVGSAFAHVESALIIARLVRRYDFRALAADRVRPVASLTTRPIEEIRLQVTRR